MLKHRETLKGLEIEFIVEEIPSIGDVELVGNERVDANDIREKIGLKRGATFNDHLTLESKEEILTLYREKGYFFAEVGIETKSSQDNLVSVSIKYQGGGKGKDRKDPFFGK